MGGSYLWLIGAITSGGEQAQVEWIDRRCRKAVASGGMQSRAIAGGGKRYSVEVSYCIGREQL